MSLRLFASCCAAALLFGGVVSASSVTREPLLRTGDVVFQTSRSAQSTAIQAATDSPYSHVGVVEVTKEGAFVIEAVQPVSRTPWSRWKARGRDNAVRVMRDPSLTPEKAARVVHVARGFLGQPYDLSFAWSDKRMYCSELVQKAFERGAGIKLGRLQRLDSLKLGLVATALKERYGGHVPNDRLLITPASIAQDEKLVLVWSSY